MKKIPSPFLKISLPSPPKRQSFLAALAAIWTTENLSFEKDSINLTSKNRKEKKELLYRKGEK